MRIPVRHLGLAVVASAALLTLAGPAHAVFDEYQTCDFAMSGSQEVPPSGSAGTATGTITVNTVAKTITYSIAFGGLTGTPTAAHFHGPAAPGVNAGVKIGIGVASNPIVGTMTYNPADEADILAGNWYVNIHSSTSPGGEIRGQVVLTPVPSIGQWALIALSGMLLVSGGYFVVRRRRAAVAA